MKLYAALIFLNIYKLLTKCNFLQIYKLHRTFFCFFVSCSQVVELKIIFQWQFIFVNIFFLFFPLSHSGKKTVALTLWSKHQLKSISVNRRHMSIEQWRSSKSGAREAKNHFWSIKKNSSDNFWQISFRKFLCRSWQWNGRLRINGRRLTAIAFFCSKN